MVLSSLWRPASGMVMKCTVPTTGIHRSGLVASLPVGSCVNPTFKSENSDVMLRRWIVWTQHRFVCSILTYAVLHMITAYICRPTKSIDQKSRSLRLSAVILLQLECQSSARVKFRNGQLSSIIISNMTTLFLCHILKPPRLLNTIQMVTRH